MKKIFTLALVLVLIASMTVTTHAATPKLDIDLPEIPDISDDVSLELPAGFWDQYFKDHPIEIPEPEAEIRQTGPGWHEWLNNWYRWRAVYPKFGR